MPADVAASKLRPPKTMFMSRNLLDQSVSGSVRLSIEPGLIENRSMIPISRKRSGRQVMWREVFTASLLCFAVVCLSGCQRRGAAAPDWTPMMFLVGDWGCYDFYETRHGEVKVPLVTQISRGLGDQWLVIHREEPAWSDAPNNYIEDEYTGWDSSTGRWVTLTASTEGPQGYLSGPGWKGDRAEWDAHTFADLSLPSRRQVQWHRISDLEWEAQFHYPKSPDGLALDRQHCYKRTEPAQF